MNSTVSECCGLLTQLEHALSSVPTPLCPNMIGELERLKATVHLRMMTGAIGTDQPIPVAEAPHYLTVEEVCVRYKVTKRWVYRHKKQMPHSQPSRKVLLFPEAALKRWFERRR